MQPGQSQWHLGVILLIAVFSGCAQLPNRLVEEPSAVDYRAYNEILDAHLVGKGGLFDYAGLLANEPSKQKWQRHLDIMATVRPENLPPEERKAFWLNAYNTYCIEGILQGYPVDSLQEIPGYFDKKTYRVAGSDLTVNEMQYEILMPEFKDARLHFALVCADFGCYPLEETAFTGADLEPRLENLSYRFARDSGRFRVDLDNRVVHASKLFDKDWYDKDFTGDPARPASSAVQYMAPWLREDERSLLLKGKYRVEIIPWDWRLNEWKPAVTAP